MQNWRQALAPALFVLWLTGCIAAPAGAADDPALRQLPDVQAFKAQFNADAGAPRLVLLLSPT